MLPDIIIQAMMKYAPDYFNVVGDERLLFWKEINKKKKEKIENFILKHEIKVSKKKRKKFLKDHNSLSYNDQNKFNSYMLYLSGFGEDYFELNEIFYPEDNIINLGTLRKFDEQDYIFQLISRMEHNNEILFETENYYGNLHFTWSRYLKNKKTCYANLSMLSGYICHKLETYHDKLLNKHIPHSYENGADHGKKSRGGFVWDLKLNAHGKEELYNKVTKEFNTSILLLEKKMAKKYNKMNMNTVWILPDQPYLGLNKKGKFEYNENIVFSDISALNIRFRYFIDDIQDKIGDNKFIKKEIKKYKKKIKKEFFKQIQNQDKNSIQS